jgi:hypothetical protein
MTDLPEDLFTQIYRRAPTDEDRTRLLATKAGLGLSPRDELWPVLLVLDHYDRRIRAGHAATLLNLERVLEDLRAVPERAGPIADAEARKAIARLIDDASEKIARAATQTASATADRASRRKLIVAAIVGAISAACLAAAGAVGMYLFLEARGLCAEPPGRVGDGSIACIVQRAGP